MLLGRGTDRLMRTSPSLSHARWGDCATSGAANYRNRESAFYAAYPMHLTLHASDYPVLEIISSRWFSSCRR